jgi:16S rRNA (uracil1498-N3)-methyltransferase
MQRLFTTADLAEAVPFAATSGQTHYLAHVLRLAPGAELAAFNARHGEWLVRLTTIARNHAVLTPTRLLRPQTPSAPLTLLFAPLKRDPTDLLIRQATELGATHLHPITTDRTNTPRLNTDRLTLITQEAAEQSERLDLPTLHPLQPLTTLLATWPPDTPIAAAIERAAPTSTPAAATLLIGPEGGFSPRELDALRATRFVSPIHLGPRILRAETAAIAGLALLQANRWSTT